MLSKALNKHRVTVLLRASLYSVLIRSFVYPYSVDVLSIFSCAYRTYLATNLETYRAYKLQSLQTILTYSQTNRFTKKHQRIPKSQYETNKKQEYV